jgi:hypothetical protein
VNNSGHNTIGAVEADALPGGERAENRPIIDGLTGLEVGVIETQYEDANRNTATRKARFVVRGYLVWWFDADNEGWFDTAAHGSPPAALAAAKRYAKGTTTIVRQQWPAVAD